MLRKSNTLLSFSLSAALLIVAQALHAQIPSSLDATFGQGGKRVDDIAKGGIDRVSDILQLADGKLLVAGSAQDSNGMHRCVVIRYKTDGSFDSTFAVQGKAMFRLDNYRDAANSLAIDGSGNIIVGCLIYDMPGGNSQGAIARLRSNGALDPTFGFNGIKRLLIGSSNTLSQILRLPDGRLVLGGNAVVGGISNRCYSRLKSNGDFDSTFGTNGVALRPYTAPNEAIVYSIAVDTFDGGIVSVGYQRDSAARQSNCAIWRITAAGADDLSFGTNGKYTGTAGQYNSVVIQSDRKILAAGNLFNFTAYLDMLVTRLSPAGAVDPAFGSNGSVSYGQNYKDEEARSIIILQNGSILVGGSVEGPSGRDKDFILLSYTPTGAPNTAFSSTGRIQTDIGGSTNDFVYVVRQQSDGKILAGGAAYYAATQEDFTILRYSGFPPPLNTAVASFPRPTIQLSFYPNPGIDQWEARITGSGYYKIISLAGQVVMQQHFSSKGRVIVPAEQLSPGRYVIQGMVDGKAFSSIVIKQ